MRLHEKGGKEHEVPCHHTLEKILDDYIEAAGMANDPNGALFRSTGRKTGEVQALWQQDVYRMIQRRAAVAGIATKIGAHTFRATGITAYLKNKARWNTLRPSPITLHRARRSSMIEGATRFRSTRSRKSRSETNEAAPDA